MDINIATAKEINDGFAEELALIKTAYIYGDKVTIHNVALSRCAAFVDNNRQHEGRVPLLDIYNKRYEETKDRKIVSELLQKLAKSAGANFFMIKHFAEFANQRGIDVPSFVSFQADTIAQLPGFEEIFSLIQRGLVDIHFFGELIHDPAIEGEGALAEFEKIIRGIDENVAYPLFDRSIAHLTNEEEKPVADKMYERGT